MKKDKSRQYPYIEYDAEIKVAYVHLAYKKKSQGCTSMDDIIQYLKQQTRDGFVEGKKYAEMLNILQAQALKFKIDGAV